MGIRVEHRPDQGTRAWIKEGLSVGHRSKKAVLTALFGNLGIAVFKIAAALASGSSSMLAEGYHSVSDTFNQILLLYGLKASEKPADKEHPFGHGKEQFFWSFVVAVVLFGIAGGLSVFEGIHKFRHPQPIKNMGLNYLAVGVAVFFESFSFRLAFRNVRAEMRREGHGGFLEALRKSKDPTNLTVFVEDSLALAGLLIAGLAITLVHLTGILLLDACASVLIGVLLMGFALYLAFETRMLLVGEAVTSYRRRKILQAIRSFEGVEDVISLKTMHLSSDEVLIAVEVDYRGGLCVEDVERINREIEKRIREILPRAKVYLEACSGKNSA